MYATVFGNCLECWWVRGCEECDVKDSSYAKNIKHTCRNWDDLLHTFMNRNPHFHEAFFEGKSLARLYWASYLSEYCFYDKLEEFGFAGDVLQVVNDQKFEFLETPGYENFGGLLQYAADQMEFDRGELMDFVLSKIDNWQRRREPAIAFRRLKRNAIVARDVAMLKTICRVQRALRPSDALASTLLLYRD